MEIDFRFDLFSIIIFAGVIQGLFLVYFFLYKKSRRRLKNFFIAILFFCISMIILEIFLNYSGLIIHCIHVNNFSEPLSFAIAPLLYLYILSSIKKEQNPNHILHFLPLLLWALYSIPDFAQPGPNKINNFLDYFDPGIKKVPYRPKGWDKVPAEWHGM